MPNQIQLQNIVTETSWLDLGVLITRERFVRQLRRALFSKKRLKTAFCLIVDFRLKLNIISMANNFLHLKEVMIS
jgi:hypothetical protein